MDRFISIELFVEDSAHEHLLSPLIQRICKAKGAQAGVQIRSARGGQGKAIQEFTTYLKVRRLIADHSSPDMIIVGIDGNCKTPQRTKAAIVRASEGNLPFELVCACPDPHVERWYLADLDTFERIVGARPSISSAKCARNYYKDHLHNAVVDGGHPSTLGGLEFAEELASQMDLYAAVKADSSFKAFHADLSAGLSAILRQVE